MASIIKNQIIKHLSKFTKNLSSDKIQLSTLKGEGELSNLELNENALTELMDLPTWLKLTKADCNKVTIRVPWSKLKSQPIRLYLDEVHISMEMCDELRKPPDSSALPSYSSGGRYGFGDRVVDGMYLQINAVVINFKSSAFQATLNISRIVIQSKTPTWRNAKDLQHTRVSEKQSDMLLTFKEIDWQTLRIEADCMVNDTDSTTGTTPLRLITNQSKIRISVKKRYSDCSIVASKIQFIMDDLLWILTDSQMKAAVVFARHLKDRIDKSSEQSKATAGHTLQKQKQAQSKMHNEQMNASPSTSLFLKYDISESSYHLQSSRIDLHICDDINVPNRNRGVDGGAVGVAIMKLSLSHYPTRTVCGDRSRWAEYDENMSARDRWTGEIFKNYVKQLKQEVAAGKYPLPPKVTEEKVANSLIERLTMLRLEDFFVTTVSVEKEHGHRHKKLLMSDKKALYLPKEMSAIHVEHTEYFFPFRTDIPRPSDNAYVQINPIKFVLDTLTLTWFNSFAMSLAKDVEDLVAMLPVDETAKKERLCFKVEALMPKIVLPALDKPVPIQSDRPDGLQILISKIVVTNNHLTPESNCAQISKTAHQKLLNETKSLSLYTISDEFPSHNDDLALISSSHEQYCEDRRSAFTTHKERHMDHIETISVFLEQFWMEFVGVRNSGMRPVSFLEAFPITLWITMPATSTEKMKSLAQQTHKPLRRLSKSVINPSQTSRGEISVLIDIGAKICVQLNHYQFCFLMRLADSFTLMMDAVKNEMNLHSELISGKKGNASVPPSILVIMHVREVQFAMLAAPLISSSITQTTSEEREELLLTDRTDFGSPVSEDDGLIEEYPDVPAVEVDQVLVVTTEQIDPSHCTMDTDSGVVTTSSAMSSVADGETDAYMERSTFYLDTDATDLSPGKRARSSFFSNDTSLPGRMQVDLNPTAHKITNAFSRMTNKVKATVAKVVDDTDSWETLSITSGMSDDAEFLAELQHQVEEAAFTGQNGAGFNDDDESITSASTDRLKQVVSVTLFNICDIEVGAQVVGDDITAKICLETISTEEIGNMLYDDFQVKQLAAMTVYADEPKTKKKPIRVRFGKGPVAAKLAFGAEEKGFAHVQVQDYQLEFLSSTVSKLGPLFKDEVNGVPLPLKIEVMNFDLCLQDDATPVYTTEAPTSPLKLHVNKVVLLRTMDGVLTVQGDTLSEQNKLLEESKLPTPMADKCINTDEQLKDEETERAPSSGTVQLLEEMTYVQQENKALKEQILRLNNKLLEKDHEEFQRSEEFDQTAFSQQSEDLEFYKVETLRLKNQNEENAEELEALRKAKDCLTRTVQLLQNELLKFEGDSSTVRLPLT